MWKAGKKLKKLVSISNKADDMMFYLSVYKHIKKLQYNVLWLTKVIILRCIMS